MNLDKQQNAAVRTASWRTMVIAGAGSGKTRVLTERIRYLVEEEKVSPSEILCMTFTRKAAGVMKERLQEALGHQVSGLKLGTIHALALRMSNQFGDVIGMKSKQITVYSQWEEEFLLRDVAMELGHHNGKTWKGLTKSEVQDTFDQYYQKGIEPEPCDPCNDLFRCFIQRCKENNALTYGGLMIGLRLLIPTMAKYLNIQHILVDEIQDIDHLQWQIILDMETQFVAKLFVVGDVDQSCYEWRGAAPKYLVDHQAEFEICRLETNYRSVPGIIEGANRVIENNKDRITKTMRPCREGSGNAIDVYLNADSEWIANQFTGPSPITGRTAVLGRNRFLLEKLSRLLEEKGIKHEYVGKMKGLTEAEHFRRFHAFLKLTVNPYDNFSFLLTKDIIGLSSADYSAIRVQAAETGMSHFQVYQNAGHPHSKSLSLAAQDISERFPELSPEAVAFIHQWTEKNFSEDIAEYLDWLATYDLQDEISEEASEIMLLTIHGAKGLEWPVVIVAGCNEGILPSNQSLGNEELIEAERRLMYVAMTRAEDHLILAVRPVSVTDEKDRVKNSPESRFVAEAIGKGVI